MSNSTDKMDVTVTKTPWQNGKEWVKVTLHRGQSFFPSFEDIHRIIRAICYCEDEKYSKGEGRLKVVHFLIDCCLEPDYEKLAKKYNIPIRDGEKIVSTNGAKVAQPVGEER